MPITLSRQSLQLLAGGLVIVLVAWFVIVRLASPGGLPPAARLEGLSDAVALGILDQEVIDELREAGESRAIVHLDTAAVIAAIESQLGDGRVDELIDLTSRAYAENKEIIFRGLGQNAELVRDYAHLGAAVVVFRSEETLLTVLRSRLVRNVSADVPVQASATSELGSAVSGQEPPAIATGAGAFIGVLDTGVDVGTDPRYFPAGRIVETREIAPDDGSPDDHGHGTHVSSIVLMVAPDAGLYVADVFSVQLSTIDNTLQNLASLSDILDGVDWMIALRSQGVDIRAVNLSLGWGHYPPSICTDDYHFAEARAAQIIPVVSAGNSAYEDDDGNETTVYQAGMGHPGCVDGALSVGAVTDGRCGPDEPVDRVAEFSQSSMALELLAPGACIQAAGGVLSGTSMAAPHVAGAVAVLASEGATSAEEIWDALVNSGPPITDPNSGITVNRLDTEAAVIYLLAGERPVPTPLPTPPPTSMSRGVLISTGSVSIDDELAPGDSYWLPSIGVSNVGTAPATYRLDLADSGLVLATKAPAAWFDVSPSTVTLDPFDAEYVSTQLNVPADAPPGAYAASIILWDVDGGAPTDQAVQVTFTVEPGGLLDGELGSILSPEVVGILVVIGLLIVWRLSRPRKTA